ncbi:hypothetical protein DNL40_02350 [Xylanimonas oleitrophica]|uniref:Capsid maturation protease n=1 Tax=Xylanimonas oleitrophica TaxID=2607479 RepID=A0A2W5YJ81_9MICO|nr:hypothetical protein [Xylanimonas oleitrophica]PZR55231.1 hypothetical protein DNL40_02350 [Xylanimonas oleitrophica]
MSTTILRESTSLTEATKAVQGAGRFKVRIISAGVGSSGVYPVETIKAAAEANVFAAGTHMYLDHPSESERWDRPERSVKDLAARLVTDAVFVDEDGGALDAEIEVFTPWRAAIAEMKDAIGLSIRASAEVSENDDQGRPVISRIIEAQSVDFVTKAGRGGKVLQLVESARANVRAVERGVAEATANDKREALDRLVGDAYGADDRWVYVRDFDDANVWFSIHGETPGTYQQSYTSADGVPQELTGERIEVRATTVYVPVNEAASTATTQTTDAAPAPVREAAPAAEPNPPAVEAGPRPPHKKEDPMGTIQVDEARYAGLEEKAALVPALEAKVEAAEARAAAAESERDQAVAAAKARDFARKLASEANKDLVPASLDAIVAEATRNPLPLDAEHRLDTEKFGEVVNEARKAHETLLASIAEASGVGSVRGVGATQPVQTSVTEADAHAAALAAFDMSKGA